MTLPDSQSQIQFEVDVLIWPFARSSLFWPVCSQRWAKCICSLYERGKYRHLPSWVCGITTGQTPIITHLSSLMKFSNVIKIEWVVTRRCITTAGRHIAYVWGFVAEIITHLCFYICAWPKFLLLSSRVSIAICLDRLPGCQLIPVPSPELRRSRGESAGTVGLPVTVSSPTVILRCFR